MQKAIINLLESYNIHYFAFRDWKGQDMTILPEMHVAVFRFVFPEEGNSSFHGDETSVGVLMGILGRDAWMVFPKDDLSDFGLDSVAPNYCVQHIKCYLAQVPNTGYLLASASTLLPSAKAIVSDSSLFSIIDSRCLWKCAMSFGACLISSSRRCAR